VDDLQTVVVALQENLPGAHIKVNGKNQENKLLQVTRSQDLMISIRTIKK
jgi:hypothetical protein